MIRSTGDIGAPSPKKASLWLALDCGAYDYCFNLPFQSPAKGVCLIVLAGAVKRKTARFTNSAREAASVSARCERSGRIALVLAQASRGRIGTSRSNNPDVLDSVRKRDLWEDDKLPTQSCSFTNTCQLQIGGVSVAHDMSG